MLKISKSISSPLISPTGLLDPTVSIRKTTGQIEHLVSEIRAIAKNNESTIKEGGVKKMMMADAEKMSLADFIKKYGKENADQWKEMNESTIKEGKEDEAELVMAAKDMVTRVTSWMEDTAEMQTESMLELADAIRDEMGMAESDNFVGVVKPALESMYTAMESTREALTQGVGMLTGEGEAPAEGSEEAPSTDEAPATDEPTDEGSQGE